MDFEACRFDFRLDAKNGLTPSKRKKSERRGTCYNTLFKCKVCGSLYDNRAALLEHKLVHNDHKCPICDVKVARKATLREHLNVIHGLGKVKDGPQEGQGQIDQKAALREHIRVVRGLVRKARGGKNQAVGREQKTTEENIQDSSAGGSLQPMAQPSEPMALTGFPTSVSQPFQPPVQQVSMSMPSSVTPSSMPGYVYINVPVVMQGDQKEPNQATALPTNPVPYIPNFQGYPGFPQASPAPLKTEKKFELPAMAAAISQNNLVKVKEEPSETQGGMTLPHFPVPQSLDDLEPGEIRPVSRIANTPGFGNTMGMQLPTMVKLEDYQTNQASGLSQMISGHPEVVSQAHAQQPPPTTPHYIDMSTGNVINIQPQRLVSEKSASVDSTSQPYIFENSDFSRKPAYISTSFTADDENCVVDLSMDTTKSEAALAERLSLASQTFSNSTIEYMDTSHQSEDGVLDLSKKPSKDTETAKTQETSPNEQPKDLTAEISSLLPSSPRPSSAASSTSTSDSTTIKPSRKTRAGGLNSMVAKLWQTKIKKTKEDSDASHTNTEENSVSGDGTEHNPITLAGNDEGIIEDTQQNIEKLKLGNDSEQTEAEVPTETSPKKKKVPTATLR